MAVARYDSLADFYVAGWPDSYDDPASQALLEGLGPVRGLRVLDAACGHGRYTREFARRGGTAVVGLDISRELIDRASSVERAQPLGIRYVCDDLSSPQVLANDSFDRVACGFGLSDVDDLDDAIATIARVLVSGGRFAFSILHPCFPGAGDMSGSWPPEGRYFDEQRWYPRGVASTLRQQVGANHRTFSTYVNTLIRHGFSVRIVEEPAPDDSWSAARPAAARLPLYLVVSSTKTSPPHKRSSYGLG
jgi:SAM-dependent methyltransferase